MKRRAGLVVSVALLAVLGSSCGGSGSGSGSGDSGSGTSGGGGDTRPTVRLLTHDSFVISDQLRAELERRAGVELEVIQQGDAGAVVNQAALTVDDPIADVLFGVDNTFLSRALDAGIFDAYRSAQVTALDPALDLPDAGGLVTPIDYGDVCLNYDKAWFTARGLAPPETLDDLTDPRYRGLLVVQNPATSSPGLAFLLATVARYGDAGWAAWWRALAANDVLVVDGWEQAYNTEFSAGGGSGERPIVVSYATSPPVDVLFSEPRKDEPSIAVIEDGCFRQVEFAGVLRGTDEPDAAGRVIDFMLSDTFQSEVAPSMFVLPVRAGVTLPDEFVRFAARPAQPVSLPIDEIADNRDDWIDAWTDIVLG